MKVTLLSIFLLSVLGGVVTTAHAQDDWEYWGEYTISHKINNKLYFQLKPKIEARNDMSEFYYWEVVTGFKYKYHKNIDLGLFHLYAQEDKASGLLSKENRARVEATVKWKLGNFKWSDRSRYEFRYVDTASKSRYRNRIKIAKEVSMGDIKFTPYISNEFFVDFKADEFNQNRGTIGFEKKLTDNIKGGLYYTIRSDKKGSDWNERHILGTTFSISI